MPQPTGYSGLPHAYWTVSSSPSNATLAHFVFKAHSSHSPQYPLTIHENNAAYVKHSFPHPELEVHSTLTFETGLCFQYAYILGFYSVLSSFRIDSLGKMFLGWTFPTAGSCGSRRSCALAPLCPCLLLISMLSQSWSLSWIQLRGRDDVQGSGAFVLKVVWIKGEMRSPLISPFDPHLAETIHTSLAEARLCPMILLRHCTGHP